MIRAAVLGSPINHSLSPLLHNTAYRRLGIAADYQAIELTPERAFDFFDEISKSDWRGFSLTMPLKETIISLGEKLEFSIDPSAKRALSGNTVVRQGDNFHVTSTDRTAFQRLLKGYPGVRVAIIGGGGTARAALSALEGSDCEVDFLLRTPGRANVLQSIADGLNLKFFSMDHALDGYEIVISTVPSGVSDEIARGLTRRIPFFFEVLYNPYPTKLLARCRDLGSQTLDGIDLLVEQALDQIALFSGVEFSFNQMREELQRAARSTFSRS